jgi:hypothetical protein
MMNGSGGGGNEDKCAALFILLTVSHRRAGHFLFAIRDTSGHGALSIVWRAHAVGY